MELVSIRDVAESCGLTSFDLDDGLTPAESRQLAAELVKAANARSEWVYVRSSTGNLWRKKGKTEEMWINHNSTWETPADNMPWPMEMWRSLGWEVIPPSALTPEQRGEK